MSIFSKFSYLKEANSASLFRLWGWRVGSFYRNMFSDVKPAIKDGLHSFKLVLWFILGLILFPILLVAAPFWFALKIRAIRREIKERCGNMVDEEGGNK